MFNVGDYVVGNNANYYDITTDKSLCVVTKVDDDLYMCVKVVGHKQQKLLDANDFDGGEYGWRVKQRYFDLTTATAFMAAHPEYHYLENIQEGTTMAAVLTATAETTTETTEKEIITMDKTVTTTLTNDERNELRKEIIDLLTEYDYNPSERAINKIIDEWLKNKGWMIELFKKHPNYNGRFQIVFDTNFDRVCDKDVLYKFKRYIERLAGNAYNPKEVRIGGFVYYEITDIVNRLSEITNYMRRINNCGANDVRVNGMSFDEMLKELRRFEKKRDEWMNRDDIVMIGGRAYSKAERKAYDNALMVADLIYSTRDAIATEKFVTAINTYFPEVKAVVGQKVSRIVNKWCGLMGFNKDAEWNREFAKYSDAINPLSITRHTILSCHPVDYLTMSFGNSWASCHTIDKGNHRGMPDDYNGCYSSGTMSYMLDPSSLVFYTIDSSYTGTKYELQPKVNRNMFHIGEDKIIQARIYPQSTDGADGFYKQIREIVQKVVADCLGLSNMWKNVKGTSECSSMTISRGTHYRDYTSFQNCNVSYLKRDENADEFNKVKICIGHNPICPSCGESHDWEECIECEDCYDGCSSSHICAGCDCRYDEEDLYYIDGDWYCGDCSFYCEYHGEQEAGDYDIYVEGYGTVCESAIDSEDFFCCEHCSEWHHIDDAIETEDGTFFCCENCATRDGYICINDKWYSEDDVVTCEHCGEVILEDDALETEDGTWFCDSECAAAENYVELAGGEWYHTDEVHVCDRCGAVVHDDDWNEDYNCCDECAEELEDEEEDEE